MIIITCSGMSIIYAQNIANKTEDEITMVLDKVKYLQSTKKHKETLHLADSVLLLDYKSVDNRSLERLYWYKSSALYAMGKYKKAISSFKGGLELVPVHDTLALSDYWQKLGTANIYIENKNEALNYLNLIIDNKAFYILHKIDKLVIAYNDRGSLYAIFSELDKSTEDMNQAISLLYQSQNPNIELAGNINLNIGGNFLEIEELDSAYLYYIRAESLYQQSLPDEHYKFGSVNYNLGSIEAIRGNLLNAKKHLQLCETNWKKNYGPSHPRIAIIYLKKNKLFTQLGDYEKALSYGSKALKLLKENKITRPSYFRSIHNNLAITYGALGLYSEALLQNDEAKKIIINTYGDLSIHFYRNEYFRAETYIHSGDRENAIKTLESVLLHIDIVNYPFLTARCYYQLGLVYGINGNYKKAHQLLDIAIETYQTKAYQIVIELPQVMMSKIELYLKQDELDMAKVLLDDLQLGKFKKIFSSTTEPLNVLDDNIQLQCKYSHLVAKHYKSKHNITGHQEDLIQSYDKYMEAIDKFSLWQYDIEEDKSILKLTQDQRSLFSEAISVVEQLYQSDPNSYFESAIKIAHLSKNTILKRKIAANRNIKSIGIPDSIADETSRLKNLISSANSDLNDASIEKIDSSVMVEITNQRANLYNLKQKLANHINKIKKTFPAYYKKQFELINIDISSIQNSLSDREAIIEYMLFDSILYTILIDKNQQKLLKSNFSTEDKNLIKSLYLANTNNTINKAQSVLLYNTLYKPLIPYLGAEITKLVIIPDGILSYLPFEILMDTSGSYLISNKSIRYSWTIDELKDNKKIEINTTKLLGYCPAILEGSTSLTDTTQIISSTYPLKGSQAELDAISSIWESSIYEGRNATENSFKQKCDGYQVLHLSTHGVINDDNPLLSHLIFHTENDTIDNGKLHSWEIYNLSLDADLVVLSACNTGTGKMENTEGVQSLSRSFASAGVSSTIMSLWEIPDYSTSRILSSFYSYLKEGMSKSDALQLSKLDYIKEVPSLELKKPYFWAGLVLIGSDEPLVIKRNNNRFLWFGLISLLVLILFLGYRKSIKLN